MSCCVVSPNLNHVIEPTLWRLIDGFICISPSLPRHAATLNCTYWGLGAPTYYVSLTRHRPSAAKSIKPVNQVNDVCRRKVEFSK